MNFSRLPFLFVLFCFAASTSHTSQAKNTPEIDIPTYYIYLAGPEVFLPDPIAAGVEKKEKISQLNQQHAWPFVLVGLYPMDNAIENFAFNPATGMKIYHANIDLMRKADFVVANMVRFRGPSMDVGTAFEMGFMRGLNKPVFAYYDSQPFYGTVEKPGLYVDRIKQHYPIAKDREGFDADGQSIENFGMADNLMMIGALESGSNEIADDFDTAIMQIANTIQQQSLAPVVSKPESSPEPKSAAVQQ